MIVFADTNWLEALYIPPLPSEKAMVTRSEIVARRMRRAETLTTSHIVLMEARNVFSRIKKEREPQEWKDLVEDFGGGIYVDPMNWDLLRRETNRIFEEFSHKATFSTFDAAIVASAVLAGTAEFLTFDERLASLATAAGLKVFPPLTPEGRAFLLKLRV